jgi:hypothetical protein
VRKDRADGGVAEMVAELVLLENRILACELRFLWTLT